MYTKHLSAGDVDPPRTGGTLRVYSNKFCPYAQRVQFVLRVKKIPHETVNIHLSEKPEWYLQVNPKGQVPCLIDGSKTVTESLDICDYLDEKYPEHPLYPSNAAAKQRDQEVIQKIGQDAPRFFMKFAMSDEKVSLEEWRQRLVEALQPLEDELAQRGTTYFGGEKPGMIDFVIWPWPQRFGFASIKLGQEIPLKATDLPLYQKWRNAMFSQKVSQELDIDSGKLFKMFQARRNKQPVTYDD